MTYTLENSKSENERLSRQAMELYGGTEFIEPFIQEGMNILDVGCGTGVMTHRLALRYPSIKITGVDVDISRAIDQFGNSGLSNLHFMQGDALNLPFHAASFDLVYCRFVLFHVLHAEKAVREMFRVAKSKSKVVACEVMHDAVWLWPPKPAFERLLSLWIKKMIALGQDPLIGPRLNEIFNAAGAKEICLKMRTDSYTGDTAECGRYTKNWGAIINGARAAIGDSATDADFDQMKIEMEAIGLNSYFLELTPIISGEKP